MDLGGGMLFRGWLTTTRNWLVQDDPEPEYSQLDEMDGRIDCGSRRNRVHPPAKPRRDPDRGPVLP